MLRREHNLSKPLESSISADPFVLLLAMFLMIVVGQCQISTSLFAAKNNLDPVNAKATLPLQGVVMNSFQPIIFEAVQHHGVEQEVFRLIEPKMGVGPLNGPDDNAPYQIQKESQAENKIHSIIIEAAQRHQVDPAIIKAIIMAESNFNPKAVSNKGARGLMQLMPRTAKYLGVKDSFNPEDNIEGGVRYFKTLLDRFGCDVELALAAYNAGSRNIRKYEGVPPFKATKF